MTILQKQYKYQQIIINLISARLLLDQLKINHSRCHSIALSLQKNLKRIYHLTSLLDIIDIIEYNIHIIINVNIVTVINMFIAFRLRLNY
jgi:hypothetical protein